MTTKESITEQILRSLRKEIISGKYDTYDLITEGEVSIRFKVSKTPAREALNSLCTEGLLEKLPRRGFLVKGLSPADYHDMFELRCVLESAAVKLAIQYASDEEIRFVQEIAKKRVDDSVEDKALHYNELDFGFHVELAKLCGNRMLVEMLIGVMNQLGRAQVTDWKFADVNSILALHEQIGEAVLARNEDDAIAALENERKQTERRAYRRGGVRF